MRLPSALARFKRWHGSRISFCEPGNLPGVADVILLRVGSLGRPDLARRPDPAATDEKTLDRVYAVNVKAPFFLTAVIAPAMAQAGSGAIINLGSWIARLGIPVGALYGSTKGAMQTLTRAWAAEFGPHGVRVNAISPGVVQTPAPGEVHPGEVMMQGARLAVPETLRPSRPPRSTSPTARPRSSAEACWTWTAAAPRRPSSPGRAEALVAMGVCTVY